MSVPGRPPTRIWPDLAAGLGPEELDEAAAQLLMMIDQDGPEPCEKEQARTPRHHPGPAAARRVEVDPGPPDAEAGAYWEAILAKEAAPGANIPDDETCRMPTRAERADADRRAGPNR